MSKCSELKRGNLKEAPQEIAAEVVFQEWSAVSDKQRRVFFWFFSFAEKENNIT